MPNEYHTKTVDGYWSHFTALLRQGRLSKVCSVIYWWYRCKPFEVGHSFSCFIRHGISHLCLRSGKAFTPVSSSKDPQFASLTAARWWRGERRWVHCTYLACMHAIWGPAHISGVHRFAFGEIDLRLFRAKSVVRKNVSHNLVDIRYRSSLKHVVPYPLWNRLQSIFCNAAAEDQENNTMVFEIPL